MKTSIITTGIVAGLLFASSSAMAAPYGKKNLNIKGVNVAQIEQTIERGVRSGKLTTRESRTAHAGLNSLKATIRAVKKDRKVTKWEKSRVQIKSAKLKRTINKLLKNRAVAKSARQSRRFARR